MSFARKCLLRPKNRPRPPNGATSAVEYRLLARPDADILCMESTPETPDCRNRLVKIADYYNNQWQVVEEYDSGGTVKRKYLYGNYIDEVLYSWGASPSDPRTYYVHDHLYSPVALVNYAGTVVERYEYDVYGKPTIYTAPGPDGTWLTSDDVVGEVSAQDNCYLFTGRSIDVLDGNLLKLQYNRNRYYDYDSGRWSSQDPVGYIDGLNVYEYVRSAPLTFTDSAGQAAIVYGPAMIAHMGPVDADGNWGNYHAERDWLRNTPVFRAERISWVFPCYQASVEFPRVFTLDTQIDYVAPGAIVPSGARNTYIVDVSLSNLVRMHEWGHHAITSTLFEDYLGAAYDTIVAHVRSCGCTLDKARSRAAEVELAVAVTLGEFYEGMSHKYNTELDEKHGKLHDDDGKPLPAVLKRPLPGPGNVELWVPDDYAVRFQVIQDQIMAALPIAMSTNEAQQLLREVIESAGTCTGPVP